MKGTHLLSLLCSATMFSPDFSIQSFEMYQYQILHYPPETENFNILMPASLRYLRLSLNLMSSCLLYQQISITGRCRKNGIVRCILLHGYGLTKRRTEGKPCDYVIQYVLACNNAQKLIPCHIGVYCFLHVL